MSNGFPGRAMFPSWHDMTLEIMLWLIPAGCLAAASVLIAVRAWKLTRDGVIGTAILARAGDVARELGTDAEDLPIEIPAGENSRIAPPVLANPRLCPVPIVLCARR